MTNGRLPAWIVGAALLIACPFARSVVAQADPPPSGWLEGIVTFDRAGGAPAKYWRVTAIDQAGNGLYTGVDAALRGLYSLRSLKPGTYEVTVTTNGDTEYRPQRIFGVVLRPGVRTTLNIVLEKGGTLQEVGRPVVTTEPVLVLSQELVRLQRDLARVQAEVDSLKRRKA